jgi:hypothetical protein
MTTESKRVRNARQAFQQDPNPDTARELLAAKDESGWSPAAIQARERRPESKGKS